MTGAIKQDEKHALMISQRTRTPQSARQQTMKMVANTVSCNIAGEKREHTPVLLPCCYCYHPVPSLLLQPGACCRRDWEEAEEDPQCPEEGKQQTLKRRHAGKSTRKGPETLRWFLFQMGCQSKRKVYSSRGEGRKYYCDLPCHLPATAQWED